MDKTTYLGETDSKRVARYQAANALEKLNKIVPPPNGMVVSLCGDIAGDVGCLRDIHGFKPEQVLFVENHLDRKSGLAKAKNQWKGVETYFGDVEDVLRNSKWPLAYLIADCTGRLTFKSHTISILQAAAPRLVKGSAVSFTHFRGRDKREEQPFGNSMIYHQKPGETLKSLRKRRGHGRAWMYTDAIQKMIGGPSFRLIKALNYDSRNPQQSLRHSPMGMLVFRNIEKSLLPSSIGGAWEEIVKADTIKSGEASARLKNVGVALITKGYGSKEIAAILNIREPVVRAWRAHETRGTYQEQTPTGRTNDE